MKPEWAELNPLELGDYVKRIQARFTLSRTQTEHLQRQLRIRLQGVWLGQSLGEKEARKQLADDGIIIEQKHVGAGLGEKTVTLTHRTREALRRAKKEGYTVKRVRKKRARRPFSFALSQDLQRKLDDALWSCNCLQIGYQHWLVPLDQHRPYEGVWWYVEEIRRLHLNAQNQCIAHDAEFAAHNAFKAGKLFGELGLVLAHNEFFQKQQSIARAQREAPMARRLQSDEERRRIVRHFMQQGDKPTHAAENAARALGVSLSTIRRAFPNGSLPSDLDDF